MTDLRTVLLWLEQQEIATGAEAWILSDTQALPVTGLEMGENASLASSPMWSEPTPTPLKYGAVYDKLIAGYAGGGQLQWDGHVSYTYRGSYVVNPESAVFFLFLPKRINLIESHTERMENRKQLARQLTQEIETAWQTSQ